MHAYPGTHACQHGLPGLEKTASKPPGLIVKKDTSRGRVGNDSSAMVRILGKRECIRRLTMAVSPVSVAHDNSQNLKI